MPVTAASANRDSPPSNGTAGYDYANYFEVGFSHEEILLRFAQVYDGTQDQTDSARIVMTPRYARALLMLLQGTLARFEAVHQSMAHPAAAPDGTDAVAPYGTDAAAQG